MSCLAGKVISTAVEPGPLLHIVQNLRPRDRAEIFALRWHDDPARFVDEFMPITHAMSWIWWRDGEPIAIQGTMAIRPGVWENYAFGTDRWPEVVISMTRHARRYIMPALLRSGFHRASAHALASHTDSRRWIESLGAHEEGQLRGLGKAGEDFVSYVWRPGDILRFVPEMKQ